MTENRISQITSDKSFQSTLSSLLADGYRIDAIFPADDPQFASLSRGAERLQLSTRDAPSLPHQMPDFEPRFALARANGAPAIGRAGMQYSDLIPDRLGGRFIASRITVEHGGIVDDWVHYHRIALQLIVVRRGWAKVIYEDQGDAFVMEAGDIVLQPPTIRHRVLECSPDLEVIELASPALHETFADHDMDLPNRSSGRSFGRQKFFHHDSRKVPWEHRGNAMVQDVALAKATSGLAIARFLSLEKPSSFAFEPHEGELVFGVVFEGRATVKADQEFRLDDGDAFIMPPNLAWDITATSDRFTMLHIATDRMDMTE